MTVASRHRSYCARRRPWRHAPSAATTSSCTVGGVYRWLKDLSALVEDPCTSGIIFMSRCIQQARRTPLRSGRAATWRRVRGIFWLAHATSFAKEILLFTGL